MSGDYSRWTFDSRKHYSGVLIQQGRVQLDADSNEQLEIQQHRIHTEANDVIGARGVPKGTDGFKIGTNAEGTDLTVSPGRIYVNGLLCESEIDRVSVKLHDTDANKVIVPSLAPNAWAFREGQWLRSPATATDDEPYKIVQIDPQKHVLTFDRDLELPEGSTSTVLRRIVTYLHQPYYPGTSWDTVAGLTLAPSLPPHGPGSPPASPPNGHCPLPNGMYLVYLDAWQREVSFLDDPLIQEVALGEADTTMRRQNVWQVRLLRLTGMGFESNCRTQFKEWVKLIDSDVGRMNARIVTEAQDEPCEFRASRGYHGAENQLYRLQIHHGGSLDETTFKWSRENASIETRIKVDEADSSVLIASGLRKDKKLGFGPEQWVEIVDEHVSLGEPLYPLVQIDHLEPDANQIILKYPLPDEFKNRSGLKLRRWDQEGDGISAGLQASEQWTELESGIEVMFSPGEYHRGDYWLIPARTANNEIQWPPYEVPNTDPLAQPPMGIQHHYCRLALVNVIDGKIIGPPEDCRRQFPALTELAAEDVSFDNENCQLPGADTVQEALDLLCAVKDLREHNKYLHGYGVVCGLKVRCHSDRRQVVIGNGYALDCEGNPIYMRLDNEEHGMVYDIVANASKVLSSGIVGPISGKVCLTIERDTAQSTKVRVEPYIDQPLLEDTLLQDFYDDCVGDILDLLKDQFFDDLTSDAPPVPMSQRRLTALLNLLWQVLNPDSGRYIFLSGTTDRPKDEEWHKDNPPSNEDKYEDTLLWCFYHRLKDEIVSRTYCAMFDGDELFPHPYPLEPGLETIFGPTVKFHHRLHLHPTGQYAYTCGSGNKVYVYNLKTKELVQSVAFPAGSEVHVQDIAVAPEGGTLHAVAIQDDVDSVFSTARIGENGLLTWGATSTKCGYRFVRLAAAAAEGELVGGKLYATAKGGGLYRVVGIGTSTFKTEMILDCNATGLLALSEQEDHAIVATFGDGKGPGPESERFNRIKVVDLPSGGIVQSYNNIEGTDFENDILCHGNRVYVTGDKDSKNLYYFDIGSANPGILPLPENTHTRLTVAPSTPAGEFLLMTEADKFKVVRINLDGDGPVLDKDFRIPVQVFPMDIVTAPDGTSVYVLNSIVNTLTAIDIRQAFDLPLPNYTDEAPVELEGYREDVMDAFKDLLSHFGQYLKDCFCDKFLVECPECDDDDKVYLGCVEIRNNEVYNICNFKKRRYAKSFRTWEYWLSTVPIGPLAKKAFTSFCCKVLESERKQNG